VGFLDQPAFLWHWVYRSASFRQAGDSQNIIQRQTPPRGLVRRLPLHLELDVLSRWPCLGWRRVRVVRLPRSVAADYWSRWRGRFIDLGAIWGSRAIPKKITIL
jgi:hypothetical protein